MRTALPVVVAGLCAGSLLAAQAPPAVQPTDVKVIAQIGSQVAGIIGAFGAMGNPADERDYARAINTGVYDTVFTSVELPNAEQLDPLFPELMPVAAHVLAQVDKLDGTVLASRTTYEVARSAKEMVSALHAHQAMERAVTNLDVEIPDGFVRKKK